MLSSFKRRVKIVATLGPASATREVVSSLVEEGLDVARLNFSHGTHPYHRSLYDHVRDAAKRSGKPVAVMQDLQGPKLRCGVIANGPIDLKPGDTLLLYPEGAAPGGSQKGRIAVPISKDAVEAISGSLSAGGKVLFDDGRIITRASSTLNNEVIVEVEVGGKLSNNKGINLPGTPLSIPCLTPKDLEDLKFGISIGVDAIALSFVRRPEDIQSLRDQIKKQTNRTPLIISKIELEEGVERKEEIVDVSDGLLIARGDMAVELGAERVPIIQKELIYLCNELGVPVITATQMLESMVSAPTPTRAEASDVANAVFDGTDAVMLSGETASGQYPIEAVRTMSRIVIEAERHAEAVRGANVKHMPVHGSVVDAIELSASEIAEQVDAVAIACLTHSGMAAKTLARFRPKKPIVAIMDREDNLRKLAFVWGVRGVLIDNIVETDDLFAMVENVLLQSGYAFREDLIVVTAGIPTLRRGTTNMVKVHKVGVKSERQF